MGVLGIGRTPAEKYEKSSLDKTKIKYDDGITTLSLNSRLFTAITPDETEATSGDNIDKVIVQFFNFKYQVTVFKKKQVMIYFFGGTWKEFNVPVSDDLIIEEIELDENSGLLAITSKSKIIYGLQLTNRGQAHTFGMFLNFIKLRDSKVLSGYTKHLKLTNESNEIEVEINNPELQNHEELIHDLSHAQSHNGILIHEKIVGITNLRLINDIWPYPNNFPNFQELEIPDILMNNVFNFSHDEYDEVVASNVKKTREEDIVGGVNSRSSYWNLVQSSVNLSYNESKHHASSIETEIGDIIFMADGKKFYILENIKDPQGVVGLIKSAKNAFKNRNQSINQSKNTFSDDDPLKIIKMRLAKGEITFEEFEKLKNIL
jgi:hypothetical protein